MQTSVEQAVATGKDLISFINRPPVLHGGFAPAGGRLLIGIVVSSEVTSHKNDEIFNFTANCA